jgi:undecaprenyl-diphosphatase
MTILQAVVLGLVQGATEFVPVSSSAHLVLIPWLLGWDDPGLTYDVVVHLGTLAALILCLWQDILRLLSGMWQIVSHRKVATAETRLVLLILLSAIPAALLGYLASDFVEGLLRSPRAVSFLLLVTGLLLVGSERLGRRDVAMEEMTPADALVIGLAQGCAILPGISRSGATISACLVRGLRRYDAARFSLLMTIPVIVGASGSELVEAAALGISATQVLQLAAGFLTAAVSGCLAIRFLLRHLTRHTLRPFAGYCWGLGLAGLIISLAR